MVKLLSRAVMLGAMLVAPLGLAGAQNHVYQLNNSLADQNGGPSLVSDGGTLSASGYTFAADQGLNLSNVFTLGNVYTIAFDSYLTDYERGYTKMVDYANLTLDAGYYSLSGLNGSSTEGTANLYNEATGLTHPYVDNTLAFTVITRTAAGVFTVFVNGAEQFQSNDLAPQQGVFTAPGNLIRFFEDDTHTGGSESSAGFVDYIATYDSALSDADAAALTMVPLGSPTTTPEPASLVLVGTGLIGVAGIARRRRRNS